MSAEFIVHRRGFVAGCLGGAGWLLLPRADATVEPARLTRVSVIIDPDLAAAAAFGAALSRRGAQLHSVAGDRYRSANNLLRAPKPPLTVAGLGTYADFIVTTGVLREHRYEMVSYGVHSLSSATEHLCFGHWVGCEPALSRSGLSWPAALAALIDARVTSGTGVDRSYSFEGLRGGALLSWVMRARNARRFA